MDIKEISESVAEVTLELIKDSIDWRIADFDVDGDDYDAIHAKILFRAVEQMYMSTKRTYYEVGYTGGIDPFKSGNGEGSL